MRTGGILLAVALSTAGGAWAAPLPRELKDVAPRIDREVRKGRAPVEAARKKLQRAEDALAAAASALQAAEAAPPPPDPAAIAKAKAAVDRARAQLAAPRARLAEAEKAAQPFDPPARALSEYVRGNWQAARDAAQASKLPAVAHELTYVGALSRMRLGELKEAVERLDQPELQSLGETQRFLGLAKARLGDRAGALAHLQRARLLAEDGEAHAALGELYLGEKKMAEAAAELEKAVKATPGDTRLLGLLGRAQLELGKNELAARTLERLVKLAPRDHEAAYLEAVARARAGDSEGAERALGRYLSKTRRAAGDARYERPRFAPWLVPTYGYQAGLPVATDEAAAHNQLAVYLAQRGEHEQARRELDAATPNTTDSDARAAYNRGLLEIAAGRLAQARTALERAAKADASRPDALQALGVQALLAGDAAQAAEAFTQAAARTGEKDLQAIGLAVAQALLGKAAEAERELTRLSAKKGAVGHAARVDLAQVRLAAGHAPEALKALGSAGGDDDHSPEAAFVRGAIEEKEQSLDAALAAYGHAVTLAPNYVDALTALGRVAEQKGDHAAARVALERAIALAPDEAEPHALYARALAGLGDEKAAQAEDDRARRLEAQARAEAQKRDGASIAAPTGAKVVGVTAFDNTGKDPKVAWLAVGIAEALASDLPKLGGIRVVERAQIQKALDEVRLQQLAAPDAQSAPEVGKLVGADALLVGSYQIVGGQIRVLGRLVAVANGQVLRAGESSGPLGELFAVERKLALDLLSDYAGAAGAAKDAFVRAQAPALGSLEAVARAQVALASGDTREARDQLKKASAADPGFAAGYGDLAKSAEASANAAVLPFTNSSKRAGDEWLAAGIAEALSGDLRKLGVPQVERLAIDKVLTEKRFVELFADGGAGSGEAQLAGKQLGAKALVLGAFQSDGQRLRIDARLVNVETNQLMVADHVEGNVAELFQLETQLAVNLGKQLNPKVSPSDAAELADEHPTVAALEARMKGRQAAQDGIVVQRLKGEAPAKVAEQLQAAGVAMLRAATTPPPPAPLGKQAVPAVIETRVLVLGERLRVEGRVVDQRNQRILATSSVEGAPADGAALAREVADRLARAVASLPAHGGVR